MRRSLGIISGAFALKNRAFAFVFWSRGRSASRFSRFKKNQLALSHFSLGTEEAVVFDPQPFQESV
jgi:hypothetical protein